MTASIVGSLSLAYAQQEQRGATSYLPVEIKESFASIMARMEAAKPDIEKEHTNLLSARYDLSNRPAKDATMSRGKPLQDGVRVKLPAGVTWDQLALHACSSCSVLASASNNKGLLCKPIHRALVASKRLSPVLETNQRAWLEKKPARQHAEGACFSSLAKEAFSHMSDGIEDENAKIIARLEELGEEQVRLQMLRDGLPAAWPTLYLWFARHSREQQILFAGPTAPHCSRRC